MNQSLLYLSVSLFPNVIILVIQTQRVDKLCLSVQQCLNYWESYLIYDILNLLTDHNCQDNCIDPVKYCSASYSDNDEKSDTMIQFEDGVKDTGMGSPNVIPIKEEKTHSLKGEHEPGVPINLEAKLPIKKEGDDTLSIPEADDTVSIPETDDVSIDRYAVFTLASFI